MMRRYLPCLSLLILLIVQGCAPRYQTATPYPSKQMPPHTDELDSSHPGITEPWKQPGGQTKSLLISDISQQADQQMRSGQLQAAAQTLERGLRIAPKDASLWSQLADIRLQQHLYDQAVSLATKSNSLAGGNAAIINRNQRIIQEAKRGQK